MRLFSHKYFIEPANVCRGLILFLIVQYGSILGDQADNKSTDTLAVAGNSVITANSFINSFKSKLKETGLPDNIEIREKYLLNLINDELLIQEARRKGIDKSPGAAIELKRIEVQELLNAYTLKHISPAINIEETVLRDLYIKLNKKVKVSHIYASSKAKADSLYKELLNGKEFEKLAGENFNDPVLRDNGGSIGYISIDEMDPEFEKRAFLMNAGEISEPVKTVQGYSIIRVEDIKSNPLLTETEYLKARSNLERFARKRAIENASKEYAHSLTARLNINYNNKLVAYLFKLIKEKSLDQFIEQPHLLSDRDLDLTVVSSGLGDWSLQTLVNEMQIVTGKQQQWIKTEENLRDFITGLINRKYIVTKAVEEKLDKEASYLEKVDFAFDSYLLNSIETKIRNNIQVSEEEIKTHYDKHVNDFITEPEIRLSIILLDRNSLADSIKQLLSEGTDFSELAEKFSIQTLTAATGGDAGFFKKSSLEYLGDTVYNLKIGEWTGPHADNDKFVFLKCTGKKKPGIKSPEEVSGEIKESLIAMNYFKERENSVKQIKEMINVKIDRNKLIELKF